MVDDVMQARIAIECQAIRLACEHASIAEPAAGAGEHHAGSLNGIGRT